MLVAKQFSSSFLSFGAVVEAVRVRLGDPHRGEILYPVKLIVEASNADTLDEPTITDRDRYARILDHELDRQLLTEVEREDTEMLNRVRAALYGD